MAPRVYQQPTCLLCGVLIPWTNDRAPDDCYGMRQSTNVDEREQTLREGFLKRYWKRDCKQHMMVSSKEVEEAHFKQYPNIWSSFCRSIIKEPNTGYRLAGITKVNPLDVRARNFYSLKDPTMACIGSKRSAQYKSKAFTCFRLEAIRETDGEDTYKVMGHVVHANCWVLFGHLLGTALGNVKLEQLICASRKYWHDHKYWKLQGWVGTCCHGAAPCLDGRCYISQNPLIIPAVQKAIYDARFMVPRPYPCFSLIPLEIGIMIAEIICPVQYSVDNVDDTRNLIFALQWKLPAWFWRARLNDDLFFELGELKNSTKPVDWQMLRLELMGLVSDRRWYNHNGLANRERIFGHMAEIKKTYLELL